MDLNNKVAIITGGGSGLGFGLAKALLNSGGKVVIASRDKSKIDAAVAKLEANYEPGHVVGIACDIRRKAEVEKLVRSTISTFGGVDILINNSGLAIPDLVENCQEEDWDQVMETNVKGCFLMSQAVLPQMKKQNAGFILNIASQAAKNGYANVASYCASKFAVVGFGEALKHEVKDHGIRVHSVCPGLIQVPEPSSSSEHNSEILQVQDVVETILFVLTRPAHVNLENIGLYNLFDKDV